MNAFVIGDSAMVTGFKLIGVEGVVVYSVDEAKQELSKAIKVANTAIIIISEEFSSNMHKEIIELQLNQITPLIVEVPGRHGPSGNIALTEIIHKAMGIEAQ